MADVKGLEELQTNITRLNARVAAELPRIVMGAAAIVEQEIRNRAPVETGALVANLDTVEDLGVTRASATVQIEKSGKSGAEHYAIFDEYGTSKMPAKPFFRPGVEAAKSQVESKLKQIVEVINEAGGT